MNNPFVHGWILRSIAILGMLTTFGLAQEPSPSASRRYCIMDFKGTSEYPHANQLKSVGGGFGEELPHASEGVDYSAVSNSLTRYILIADTQDLSLDVFFDMSLWKLGHTELDPLQVLWHLKGEKVSSQSSWGSPMSNNLIWSVKTGSLFADVFELPVTGPLEGIVASIAEQCRRPKLGNAHNDSKGTWQRQRVVDADGRVLILNESDAGQIQKALRAEQSEAEPFRFRCKLIIYTFEKPIETIEGELTLSMAEEFPVEVAAWAATANTKPVQTQTSFSSPISAAGSDFNRKVAFNWPLLFAIGGGISLVCVLFGVHFLSRKQRNEL